MRLRDSIAGTRRTIVASLGTIVSGPASVVARSEWIEVAPDTIEGKTETIVGEIRSIEFGPDTVEGETPLHLTTLSTLGYGKLNPGRSPHWKLPGGTIESPRLGALEESPKAARCRRKGSKGRLTGLEVGLALHLEDSPEFFV